MTGGSEPGDNLSPVWLIDLLVLKAGFFQLQGATKAMHSYKEHKCVTIQQLESTFLMVHNLFKFQNLQYSFEGKSWDLLFSKCFNASEWGLFELTVEGRVSQVFQRSLPQVKASADAGSHISCPSALHLYFWVSNILPLKVLLLAVPCPCCSLCNSLSLTSYCWVTCFSWDLPDLNPSPPSHPMALTHPAFS